MLEPILAWGVFFKAHAQWQPAAMGKMDVVILPASDYDINASVRVDV